MNSPEHGGEVFRAARELNLPLEEILDFSASINPLGMPPGVRRAAAAAITEAVHYPDSDAVGLIADLADYHGLPPNCLLSGSGSTELLYLFPRVLQPRRVLLVAPAFSEYARALRQAGAAIEFFPLSPEADFRFEPQRLLRAVEPDIDLVLLANPGNPTGAGIAPEVLEEVARSLAGQAVLAIDEAFIDFCPQISVIDRVPFLDNLYVFRSLTKFFAIPGLRAGYLAGPVPGIARLAAERLPWSLSVPAQAAARACLHEEEYRSRTLTVIADWRRELAQGLAGQGLTVYPSSANYLLFRLPPGMSAAALAGELRQKGILVRKCSDFPPLDGRFLRAAVRTAGENERLLAAFREIMTG